jgi:hypothetical protein
VSTDVVFADWQAAEMGAAMHIVVGLMRLISDSQDGTLEQARRAIILRTSIRPLSPMEVPQVDVTRVTSKIDFCCLVGGEI